MMIRRSAALAAFSALLFLAGCAGNTADTGSTAGGPPASAPAASAPGNPAVPSAGADAGIPDADTSGDPKPGAVQTLTGPVTAGVEPGCLILTTTRGPHLLVSTGAIAKSLRAGTTMTVTGRAEPGMVTTCQQGTPFVVTSVAAE